MSDENVRRPGSVSPDDDDVEKILREMAVLEKAVTGRSFNPETLDELREEGNSHTRHQDEQTAEFHVPILEHSVKIDKETVKKGYESSKYQMRDILPIIASDSSSSFDTTSDSQPSSSSDLKKASVEADYLKVKAKAKLRRMDTLSSIESLDDSTKKDLKYADTELDSLSSLPRDSSLQDVEADYLKVKAKAKLRRMDTLSSIESLDDSTKKDLKYADTESDSLSSLPRDSSLQDVESGDPKTKAKSRLIRKDTASSIDSLDESTKKDWKYVDAESDSLSSLPREAPLQDVESGDRKFIPKFQLIRRDTASSIDSLDESIKKGLKYVDTESDSLSSLPKDSSLQDIESGHLKVKACLIRRDTASSIESLDESAKKGLKYVDTESDSLSSLPRDTHVHDAEPSDPKFKPKPRLIRMDTASSIDSLEGSLIKELKNLDVEVEHSVSNTINSALQEVESESQTEVKATVVRQSTSSDSLACNIENVLENADVGSESLAILYKDSLLHGTEPGIPKIETKSQLIRMGTVSSSDSMDDSIKKDLISVDAEVNSLSTINSGSQEVKPEPQKSDIKASLEIMNTGSSDPVDDSIKDLADSDSASGTRIEQSLIQDTSQDVCKLKSGDESVLYLKKSYSSDKKKPFEEKACHAESSKSELLEPQTRKRKLDLDSTLSSKRTSGEMEHPALNLESSEENPSKDVMLKALGFVKDVSNVKEMIPRKRKQPLESSSGEFQKAKNLKIESHLESHPEESEDLEGVESKEQDVSQFSEYKEASSSIMNPLNVKEKVPRKRRQFSESSSEGFLKAKILKVGSHLESHPEESEDLEGIESKEQDVSPFYECKEASSSIIEATKHSAKNPDMDGSDSVKERKLSTIKEEVPQESCGISMKAEAVFTSDDQNTSSFVTPEEIIPLDTINLALERKKSSSESSNDNN